MWDVRVVPVKINNCIDIERAKHNTHTEMQYLKLFTNKICILVQDKKKKQKHAYLSLPLQNPTEITEKM